MFYLINKIGKLITRVLLLACFLFFSMQNAISDNLGKDCRIDIKFHDSAYSTDSLPQIGILFDPHKKNEEAFKINKDPKKIIQRNQTNLYINDKCVQHMLSKAMLYIDHQKKISKKNINQFPNNNRNLIWESDDEFEYFVPFQVLSNIEEDLKTNITKYIKADKYFLTNDSEAIEIELKFYYHVKEISIPNLLRGIYIINNGKLIYSHVFDTMEEHAFFRSDKKVFFVNLVHSLNDDKVNLTSYEVQKCSLNPIVTIVCDWTPKSLWGHP